MAKRGAVLVPPFEHADIIAGQGTSGLEIITALQGRGVVLDDMLVNCSGGGLTAGIALAFAEKSPKTKVHSVEPEGFDDYARSLRSGVREKNRSVNAKARIKSNLVTILKIPSFFNDREGMKACFLNYIALPAHARDLACHGHDGAPLMLNSRCMEESATRLHLHHCSLAERGQGRRTDGHSPSARTSW